MEAEEEALIDSDNNHNEWANRMSQKKEAIERDLKSIILESISFYVIIVLFSFKDNS